jgi:HSP20 family molecular chaperone IbpA
MSIIAPYELSRVLNNMLKVSTSTHTAEELLKQYANESRPVYISERYTQTANETAYTIEVPMVGVTKEDLSISVEGNRLLIKAKGSVKSRFTTNFAQDWVLNDDADVSAINANLANGLLTLTVPRVKPVQRTVNITVH